MIYDKVKIIKQDNSDIYQDLIRLLNDNYIKIVENESSLTERGILKIEVSNNFLIIDNKEIGLDELFKKYKFTANLFTDISEEEYLKKYSQLIKNKKEIAKSNKNKYKYHNNFNEMIGSLYISDEDYYLIKDSKLKNIIFKKQDNSYLYVIPNEDGYLLRGVNTYYYLLANKGKFDNVLSKHFYEFNDNYLEYFKLIKESITQDDDHILVLSVLDNIRNYLLVLTNMNIIKKQDKDETILIEFKDTRLKEYYKLTAKEMISILENDKYSLENIKNILDLIQGYSWTNIIEKINDNFYDKMLKSHRECDNFLENYLCMKDYIDNNKEEINYISPLYGGVELPLLALSLNDNINIYYVSLFGIYKDRHKTILNYSNEVFKLHKSITTNLESCILCDDNMMTGKTIQYIIDTLVLNNIKVNNILLINYVSLNRIYQVFDNKTLMNIELVNKFIFGLYYGTKYSKIKFNTNINNTYLDEFKLFDLSKEYICYYLYKNGIYNEKSRINNYKIGGDKQ